MSHYVTQSADTSEPVERLWFDRLRALQPWQRLQMVARLRRQTQELALAGLRLRYPQATEHELRLRLAATRFDRETMIRAFGWDPDPPRLTSDDRGDVFRAA